MLLAERLDCQRGERCLFSGLELRLEAGDCLLVEGENGSGKTSLLRMLAGLLPAEGGRVSWCGAPAGSSEFRAALCYLGHDNALKGDLTVLENLQTGARLAGKDIGRDAALAVLDEAGLTGREDLPCRYLSQGQQRRLALAGLVGEKRPLWILDEPFVALDGFAANWLSGLIEAHLRTGGVAILTSHQAVALAAGRQQNLRLGDVPASS